MSGHFFCASSRDSVPVLTCSSFAQSKTLVPFDKWMLLICWEDRPCLDSFIQYTHKCTHTCIHMEQKSNNLNLHRQKGRGALAQANSFSFRASNRLCDCFVTDEKLQRPLVKRQLTPTTFQKMVLLINICELGSR